jgi:hypothetical protein
MRQRHVSTQWAADAAGARAEAALLLSLGHSPIPGTRQLRGQQAQLFAGVWLFRCCPPLCRRCHAQPCTCPLSPTATYPLRSAAGSITFSQTENTAQSPIRVPSSQTPCSKCLSLTAKPSCPSTAIPRGLCAWPTPGRHLRGTSTRTPALWARTSAGRAVSPARICGGQVGGEGRGKGGAGAGGLARRKEGRTGGPQGVRAAWATHTGYAGLRRGFGSGKCKALPAAGWLPRAPTAVARGILGHPPPAVCLQAVVTRLPPAPPLAPR